MIYIIGILSTIFATFSCLFPFFFLCFLLASLFLLSLCFLCNSIIHSLSILLILLLKQFLCLSSVPVCTFTDLSTLSNSTIQFHVYFRYLITEYSQFLPPITWIILSIISFTHTIMQYIVTIISYCRKQ